MDANTVARACADAMWRDDRASVGLSIRLDAVARTRGARSGACDVRVTGGDGAVVAQFRGHSPTTGEKFQVAEG